MAYVVDEIELMKKNNYLLSKKVSTGTTTIALEYSDGVVLAADSRTSLGLFVANRFSDKITKVTDYIYCLRSGSSADTQCVTDVLKYHLSLYEQETNQPPDVELAANLFRNMIYKHKNELSASLIVAGWDKRLGGQVYCVPIGGILLRKPIALSGSGSTYILGYADANYRDNMSKEECIDFVTNAISLSIQRDGYSGGGIRIVIITKDGVERKDVLGDQIIKFSGNK